MTALSAKEKCEEREWINIHHDGLKLFGVFHRPLNKSQVPAVLFCHGLVGHKTGKYRVYVDLAQHLSSIGIASLRLDFRGCGDSEGHFSQATPESYYTDALAGLDFLRRHSIVDSNRIGIYGRSFGGCIAVKTAVLDRAISSIALWCPMFSGEQWYDQWQLVQTDSVDPEIKMEMMRVDGQQGSPAFWNSFFSLNLTDDLNKLRHLPLLHIHGEQDTRVSIQHAVDFERCRQTADAQSSFIRLPHTDHEFSHYVEKEKAFKLTQDFFAKTLLP